MRQKELKKSSKLKQKIDHEKLINKILRLLTCSYCEKNTKLEIKK